MAQKAHIVGKVEYRSGDGPNVEIRPGPVDVTTAVNDATLSWTDVPEGGQAHAQVSFVPDQRGRYAVPAISAGRSIPFSTSVTRRP